MMQRTFPKRRNFLAQAGAVAAGLAAPGVFAQSAYPDKPIRVVVSFAPGGSVDPMLRIVQPKLTELLGQPIIIDNRPGGATSIAAGFVTKQAPDGYNLLFTACTSHLLHTVDAPHITYDPVKDFTPIGAVSRSGWVLAVHESIPAKTVAEYIAYCKANPNKVSYASSGTGTGNHLSMERFNQATGIKTVHVPYKAGATAALDFMAGRVQAYFTGISNLMQAIQSGKVRVLAYSAARQGEVPANMTFTAAGFPDFESIDSINVLLGPAGMPAPVVARISGALEKALAVPESQAAMVTAGQYAYPMTPEQLGTRMRNEIVVIKKVIKDGNINMQG